jgi:peptide/nickel transport system substrate-binding protein
MSDKLAFQMPMDQRSRNQPAGCPERMEGQVGSRKIVSAIGLVAAIVFGACSQSVTTVPSATTATGTPGTFSRGQGGDLKVLYWQAPSILNPHLANGKRDTDAARLVLEPLASWGPNAKPVANGLAAEIPTLDNGGVSKDFTTVTWKLRTGVKWSDGSPLTADDVVFTFSFISDPKTAASTFNNTVGVKSVVAKDPGSVVVTYAAPNPNYYQWGVGVCCSILQKAQFAEYVGAKAKEAPGNQKPVGTGPYKVTSFKAGDLIQFAANENFREPSKPYFKTVNWKGGGDAASAARAVFQTGEVDYALNLQVEAAVLKPMIAASTTGTMLSAYGSGVERIVLNFSNPNAPGDKRSEPDTKHPFFSDKNVRLALAMATDRKIVAQQLYGDGLTGKAGCNFITGIPDYESKNTADFCGKFDIAGAAKLLDENGWKLGPDNIRAKDGVPLKILFQTPVNSARQLTQDIMKANWEKAGFKVELKKVDPNTFFTNTSPDDWAHFYADIEMYTNNSDPDPTSYLNAWTTKQSAAKANLWQSGNHARYQNPEYDRIIESLRVETDPKKRADLVIKANDVLILDVVMIPLVTRSQVTSGASKTLKGIVPSGWDSEMYQIADWYK